MTYDLYIGDRTFSSWSMRGWLLFAKFGIEVRTHETGLYSGRLAEDLAHLAPARTVPTVKTAEGGILTDSLAIAEHLAETYPDVDFYPSEPVARAFARSITCEMHSSFMHLRDDCSNVIDRVFTGFEPSDLVLNDLQRIETLWSMARERFGGSGPWLFSDYSIADVFYAPVACRITAYDLPCGKLAQSYIDAHLSEPCFLEWRAAALRETHVPYPYSVGTGWRPWPGDAART